MLLDRLLSAPQPLRVVDTHAGAGLYDLTGTMARKSGEAEAGILPLMADSDAPAAFEGLKAAVRRLNGAGPTRLYPGSPRLIAERLRPADVYLGAELLADDFALLEQALTPFKGARAAMTDGYALAEQAAGAPGRLLVLVDPPFERPDDDQRTADLVQAVLRRKSQAVLAIWTPLKDLETFDAFLRRLEPAAKAPILVAEARLRSLGNPLKMNGCAMIFINAPNDLSSSLEPVLQWVVQRAGEGGAQAKLWCPQGA